MEQLTLEKIYLIAKTLLDNGRDLSQYPIYIGNDDELNGIHCAWYTDILNVDDEESRDLINMINEDHHCIKVKDKAILIS